MRYQTRYMPGHPKATGRHHVRLHILVAEKAFGKPLPPGAEVHHVDENPLNNANSNLVICQSHAYHALLHVRARVLKAGGDPNTQHLCSLCQKVKDRSKFHRGARVNGLQTACKECLAAASKGRYLRLKAQKEVV